MTGGRVAKGGNYLCQHPQCDASLQQIHNLTRHRRTGAHSIYRPFACNVGSYHKTSTRSDNLDMHVTNRHRGAKHPSACSVCHCPFAKISQLRWHVKICADQEQASWRIISLQSSTESSVSVAGNHRGQSDTSTGAKSGIDGVQSGADDRSKLCSTWQPPFPRILSESSFTADKTPRL